MTIDSVVQELRQSEATENFAELIKSLDYDPGKIQEFLSSNRSDIVGLLARATEKGHIDINSDKGKTLWRAVVEFYREHAEEDLYYVKGLFYSATTPDITQFLLDMKADIIAGICRAATLGILKINPIIKDIRLEAYDDHINRLLYRTS